MPSTPARLASALIVWTMPLFAAFSLGGCASFGEGLGRALMQAEAKDDTRQCHVRGPAFDGLEQMLHRRTSSDAKAGRDMKVLMVHGIGAHVPGYGTQLAENLARELGLSVVSRVPKVLALRFQRPRVMAGMAPTRIRSKTGDAIGTVTVTDYSDRSSGHRLIFYELTWSSITDADKRNIAYDNSGEYSFRRAGINKELKEFVNSHMPDPLIYLGDAQLPIQQAVAQSICWMVTVDYDQLPATSDRYCRFDDYAPTEFRKNSFAFISHSLGSRILLDAWQSVTASHAVGMGAMGLSPNVADWQDALQNGSLSVFMLSNQLPLLQLGREAPVVTDQVDDYCTPGGARYGERIFARTNIVAFSDPNDILSWAVPPDYENSSLDSRMCPRLANVILNVAHVRSVLGREMASPIEAHSGYDKDDRVIKLIVRGMSTEHADPLIKERCEWLEVRE